MANTNEFLARLPQTHTQPPEKRIAAGKELRSHCSRRAHAIWNPPADRADPVDLLIENSKGRIERLIPIRYGRMAADPFAFYRGAAAIMAYDLSHTPSTGLKMQICGDCHLLNFGGFATAGRKPVFDINDFDETSIASWEWDVKRLATSFVIAGRCNGYKEVDNREAAMLAAQGYRQGMIKYASMPVLQAWYDALDLELNIARTSNKQHGCSYTKKLAGSIAQSEHEQKLASPTYLAGDTPHIIDQPRLIFHYEAHGDEAVLDEARNSLAQYADSLPPEQRVLMNRYKLIDTAIKVVGIGSVGMACVIALFLSGGGDPLFIQVKQARQSALEPYAGASPYAHGGQRVVTGQRLMRAAGDPFLGWYTGAGHSGLQYYARQIKDNQIKPVVVTMTPTRLKQYGRLCGQALARAHARSGDAVVLMGYLGKNDIFENALAEFSTAYADQNERDYAALLQAIDSGRIEARLGE